MKNILKQRLFILVVIVSSFFVSCEETEESGYGNYIIGVSNSTTKNYILEIFLDGKSQGSFIVKASQQGGYMNLCGDLVYAATLDNVYILTFVPSGTHQFELKDSQTGSIKQSYEFKMTADGCISQQINF